MNAQKYLKEFDKELPQIEGEDEKSTMTDEVREQIIRKKRRIAELLQLNDGETQTNKIINEQIRKIEKGDLGWTHME